MNDMEILKEKLNRREELIIQQTKQIESLRETIALQSSQQWEKSKRAKEEVEDCVKAEHRVYIKQLKMEMGELFNALFLISGDTSFRENMRYLHKRVQWLLTYHAEKAKHQERLDPKGLLEDTKGEK